jgi:hypothetical protein
MQCLALGETRAGARTFLGTPELGHPKVILVRGALGVPQFWGALGVPLLALTRLARGLAVGKGV